LLLLNCGIRYECTSVFAKAFPNERYHVVSEPSGLRPDRSLGVRGGVHRSFANML